MKRQTFYFSEGPYLQAMHGLHSALSASEAFIKFIGQPRTGKSGVCGKLTQFMRHKDYRVIYFDYAVESPDMLRSMLAKELDVPDSFNMLRHLEDALDGKQEKPLILIFDDAHQLSDITLIEIYRLAGVQVQQKRIINIVLCGEPELERRLNTKKEFVSLLQHVSHNFLLEPMDVATTAKFVQAYLEWTDSQGLEIEAAAQSQLFKSSRGFPGPAYSLAQLVHSIRQDSEFQQPLTKDALQHAIRNADSDHPVSSGLNRLGSRRLSLVPIAAVVVLASLVLLLQILNPEEEGEREVSIDTPIAQGELDANSNAVSPFALDEVNASTSAAVESEIRAVEVSPPEPAAEPIAQAATEQKLEIPRQNEVPEEVLEEVPASDSSLALVTAQERGIAQEAIAEPEFEPMESSEPATSLVGTESAVDAVAYTDSDTEADSERLDASAPIANVSLTRPMLALDDEQIQPTAVVQIEESSGADTAASVQSAGTGTEATDAAGSPQQAVERWLAAWQGQDLGQYFASYAEEFEPRYHRSRSAWQVNRERVIGNASQITLELSEFEIVAQNAETVEVHFWLAYRSPSYRDNTRKKLILKKLPEEDGLTYRFVILEEINLEVQV